MDFVRDYTLYQGYRSRTGHLLLLVHDGANEAAALHILDRWFYRGWLTRAELNTFADAVRKACRPLEVKQ